jgi:hypothetical protein
MFIIESHNSKAANKVTILSILILLFLGGLTLIPDGAFWGALFTMRIYLRPSPLVPRGFRVFGFPRP